MVVILFVLMSIFTMCASSPVVNAERDMQCVQKCLRSECEKLMGKHEFRQKLAMLVDQKQRYLQVLKEKEEAIQEHLVQLTHTLGLSASPDIQSSLKEAHERLASCVERRQASIEYFEKIEALSNALNTGVCSQIADMVSQFCVVPKGLDGCSVWTISSAMDVLIDLDRPLFMDFFLKDDTVSDIVESIAWLQQKKTHTLPKQKRSWV